MGGWGVGFFYGVFRIVFGEVVVRFEGRVGVVILFWLVMFNFSFLNCG